MQRPTIEVLTATDRTAAEVAREVVAGNLSDARTLTARGRELLDLGTATGRRGMLFDVDGTLVDTTYWHAVCWGEALAEHGHRVPMSAVHRGIGAGTGELLDLVLGDRDEAGDDALSEAHKARYREHFDDLRAFEGVRDLLQACHDDDRTIVLASSASAEELDQLRTAIASDDLVDEVTGADDAEGAKPSPDIVVAALGKGGLSAGESVLVGDSVWDGQACRAAGVPFVGLTCGGTSEAELRAAGAVEVWRDPVALREAWFGDA